MGKRHRTSSSSSSPPPPPTTTASTPPPATADASLIRGGSRRSSPLPSIVVDPASTSTTTATVRARAVSSSSSFDPNDAATATSDVVAAAAAAAAGPLSPPPREDNEDEYADYDDDEKKKKKYGGSRRSLLLPPSSSAFLSALSSTLLALRRTMRDRSDALSKRYRSLSPRMRLACFAFVVCWKLFMTFVVLPRVALFLLAFTAGGSDSSVGGRGTAGTSRVLGGPRRVRVLCIVTSASTPSPTGTFVSNLSESVWSIMSSTTTMMQQQPPDVDVFFVVGTEFNDDDAKGRGGGGNNAAAALTEKQDRTSWLASIAQRLPDGVGLELWDGAIPLGYYDNDPRRADPRRGGGGDGRKAKTDNTLVGPISGGLSTRHLYVVRDKLTEYDFFVAFGHDHRQDDGDQPQQQRAWRVTGEHVSHHLRASEYINRLLLLLYRSKGSGADDAEKKKWTEHDLAGLVPSLLPVEILPHNDGARRQRPPQPLGEEEEGSGAGGDGDATPPDEEIDPRPCCATTRRTRSTMSTGAKGASASASAKEEFDAPPDPNRIAIVVDGPSSTTGGGGGAGNGLSAQEEAPPPWDVRELPSMPSSVPPPDLQRTAIDDALGEPEDNDMDEFPGWIAIGPTFDSYSSDARQGGKKRSAVKAREEGVDVAPWTGWMATRDEIVLWHETRCDRRGGFLPPWRNNDDGVVGGNGGSDGRAASSAVWTGDPFDGCDLRPVVWLDGNLLSRHLVLRVTEKEGGGRKPPRKGGDQQRFVAAKQVMKQWNGARKAAERKRKLQ